MIAHIVLENIDIDLLRQKISTIRLQFDKDTEAKATRRAELISQVHDVVEWQQAHRRQKEGVSLQCSDKDLPHRTELTCTGMPKTFLLRGDLWDFDDWSRRLERKRACLQPENRPGSTGSDERLTLGIAHAASTVAKTSAKAQTPTHRTDPVSTARTSCTLSPMASGETVWSSPTELATPCDNFCTVNAHRNVWPHTEGQIQRSNSFHPLAEDDCLNGLNFGHSYFPQFQSLGCQASGWMIPIQSKCGRKQIGEQPGGDIIVRSIATHERATTREIYKRQDRCRSTARAYTGTGKFI